MTTAIGTGARPMRARARETGGVRGDRAAGVPGRGGSESMTTAIGTGARPMRARVRETGGVRGPFEDPAVK